jgi:uncharacterized protein YdiU (UPF0061 family)
MRVGFEHTYAALPPGFFAQVSPTPVESPRLQVFNRALAQELGLSAEVEQHAAALFSGNEVAEDSRPIAMAYAGHQFGQFVPQLGDGRALLLGEIRSRDGVLYDIQLKGSGLTPFSRAGDGRAVLGPMLREYLISEAMHALGIETTRSLAVVTTGESVYRESALPGAVLTRVAKSHIRVGTFEFFAARGDREALTQLLTYVIARHYPEALDAQVPALAVLSAVVERQAALIADWMRVGFIHGVMNTDNMAVSGETIDYGPCAFMDRYDPQTVFSSIDRRGRYAYANQPVIAQWNLTRLAETLLPLIDAETPKAVELATPVIEGFMPRFDQHFLNWMRRKIGLMSAEPGDTELVRQLLGAMHEAKADFTLTFRALIHASEGEAGETELQAQCTDIETITPWLQQWRARLARDPQDAEARVTLMRSASPAFIPRNHQVEAALSSASENGDLRRFNRLLEVLQSPYADQPEAAEYALPPEPSDQPYRTFCGT